MYTSMYIDGVNKVIQYLLSIIRLQCYIIADLPAM